MADIQGKTVAFLATDGVEQVELTDPWKAVEEAGGTPELISLEDGVVQGFNHLDKADTFERRPHRGGGGRREYDALVLPGGVANPDALRTDPDAVAFVRAFFDQGKPVAAICHAPWTLIDAEVVRGRTLTSWPSLQTDLRNAGRDLGRRGGPRRPGPRHLAPAGRPAGVLRQARRGDRRGRPRGPAHGRARLSPGGGRRRGLAPRRRAALLVGGVADC